MCFIYRYLFNHFEEGLEGVDYGVEFSDLHHVLSTKYMPNFPHVEASKVIKQCFLLLQQKGRAREDARALSILESKHVNQL